MATKTNHSKTYYYTRSIVRFCFWIGFAGLLGAGFGAILNATDNSLPECDVHMNVDFTWNVKDFASLNPNMTLADCRHPNYVVLSENGTWDWFNPDL